MTDRSDVDEYEQELIDGMAEIEFERLKWLK